MAIKECINGICVAVAVCLYMVGTIYGQYLLDGLLFQSCQVSRQVFSNQMAEMLEQKCDSWNLFESGRQLQRDQSSGIPMGVVASPAAIMLTQILTKRSHRKCTGMALRKEYRVMTDQERWSFHAAVRQLKTRLIGNVSYYDAFTIFYQDSAHFGPAFLPWHREIVHRFESVLRDIDCSVILPYWDSTMDEHLEDPRDSLMWTAQFMGNGNGPVVTGAFADWKVPRFLINQIPQFGLQLTRNLSYAGMLLQPQYLGSILSGRLYSEISWGSKPHGNNQLLEGSHKAVRAWVGGHMRFIPSAPADPLFYLHHAYFDCLWEVFRRHKEVNNPQWDYVFNLGQGAATLNERHAFSSSMTPFYGLKNKDGLSSNYSHYYHCAPRPTCSHILPNNCGSKYLFCDTRYNRCVTRIAHGGKCTKFWQFPQACMEGSRCIKGHCVKTRRPTPLGGLRSNIPWARHWTGRNRPIATMNAHGHMIVQDPFLSWLSG